MKNCGSDFPARLVLDTSAFSRFRAGQKAVLELIAVAEAVLLPVTVLGELEAGFELGTRKRANRIALAEFLDEPFVSIIPTTAEVARRYGLSFAELRRAETPVPVNDIWIAAATWTSGACLVTFDEHFRKFAGLACIVLAAD
jgi:tRNA(fMet)-specific endonuclease VapC